MKIKVSETTPIQLDWLVAKCEGATNLRHDTVACWWFILNKQDRVLSRGWSTKQNWCPSTDPAQGQPILEREGIGFFCNRTAEIGARFNPDAGADWRAFAFNKHGVHFYGPTMLIAGLRCYVASKLGDEVEVPDELA